MYGLSIIFILYLVQGLLTTERNPTSRPLQRCFCSRRPQLTQKQTIFCLVQILQFKESSLFRRLWTLNLVWHFSVAPWSEFVEGVSLLCALSHQTARFKGGNLASAARGGHNSASAESLPPSADIKREPDEKWSWRTQESLYRHLISHNHLSIVEHLVR